METFIRNENMKLYRRALAESADEDQRRVLLALLKVLGDEQAAAVPDRKAPSAEMPLDI